MNDCVVYLHELDSVRNSSEEIYHAQRAMFEEIVSNGSKVVLSFNQLTDSRAFVSLIQDDRSYTWIRELFREGTLRVSLYGNIRTASQYVQNSLKKCLDDKNVFYFSALPLKSTEKNLIANMLNVLMYDDITLLQEKYRENEDSLFADSDKEGTPVPMSREDRVKFLTRYLEMILFISQERLAANPPKTQAGGKNFYTYMKAAREILRRSGTPSYVEAENALSEAEARISSEIGEKVSDIHARIEALKSSEEAKNEIAELSRKMSPALNRSVWYRHLRDMARENPSAYETLSIAEAVVDVCYNIQVEYSISNVLKHYHDDNAEDFAGEFLNRLAVYVNPKNGAVHKFLVPESEWVETKIVRVWGERKHSIIFRLCVCAAIGAAIGVLLGVVLGINFSAVPWTIAASILVVLLPRFLGNTDRISIGLSALRVPYSELFTRWATAARVNESARKYTKGIVKPAIRWIYKNFIETPRYNPSEGEIYEEVIAKDKKSWRKERSMRLWMYAAIFVIEGAIWYRVNSFLDGVLGDVNGAMSWLIFGLVFFGVNWLLSIVGIPEIPDIIRSSLTALWDTVVARHCPTGEAYTRNPGKE